MGQGKARAFTANIFPFFDNPTFALPVVFYAVPASNPDGPASPFPDRFWDHRENWIPPGIGTDPTSFKPYFGPIPGPVVSPLVGTPDQWLNGLSYATWLAGGYSNPNGCVTVPNTVVLARFREAQQVVSIAPPTKGINQVQQLLSTPRSGVLAGPCPGLLPLTLVLRITGSGSSDGTYPLYYQGSNAIWAATGPVGAAGPAPPLSLSLSALPTDATWTLNYLKPTGIGYYQVSGQAGTCGPLHVVFTGLNPWAGDPVPGTWTFSDS